MDIRVVAALVMLVPILQATAPPGPPADRWLSRPVDDATYRSYLDFFRYESALPFNLRVLDSDGSVPGIRNERLIFDSTPGVQVYARLYRPENAGAATPSAVLLHGGVPRGKDAPNIRLNAEFLARAGWNVLAIDMMYFGERRTDLLTTFTEQEKHERLYNQPASYLAWTTQTVKDVGRSLDLLVRERKADPTRIVLIGFSRGAIVGTIAGAVHRRFRSVALLYGAHFDALEREHLAAACNANYIGRISPRPVLAINGLHDMDHMKEPSVAPLLKLAKEPREVIWAATGHQSALDDELRGRMLQWLQKTVK